MALRERYRGQFAQKATPLRLLDALFMNPYVTTARVMQCLSCSKPTAGKALAELEQHGIIKEATGLLRNRIYVAREILAALEAPMPSR